MNVTDETKPAERPKRQRAPVPEAVREQERAERRALIIMQGHKRAVRRRLAQMDPDACDAFINQLWREKVARRSGPLEDALSPDPALTARGLAAVARGEFHGEVGAPTVPQP